MLLLKHYAFTIILSLLLVVFVACAGNDFPGGPNVSRSGEDDGIDPASSSQDTVYFNSFETISDLDNWRGNSIPSQAADAPDGGGEKSALISGGCVMPHAFLTLPPTGRDSRVTVRCYGKNPGYGKLPGNGGSVALRVGDAGSDAVFIWVGEDEWTVYHSERPLLWPADSSLTIYLASGGFVSSSMLIDELLITAK